jgi:hypothetical protein
MSFGFSVSDMIALVALTKKAYYGWQQAPDEYADVVQTLKESEELVCHVQRRFGMLTASDIDSGKPKEIGHLLQGCQSAISDLRKVARHRRRLGHWDRVRFETSHISDCKNRLAHHITVLTPLLFSLELGSIGKDVYSMQTTLDRLPQVLSNMLPAALGKMIDTRIEDSRTAKGGSSMTTYGDDDDKQAYRELRKHLVSCGIKDSVVRKHRIKLVEFVKSLAYDQNITTGSVTGGRYQMTGVSDVLGPLPRLKSQVASDTVSTETVLQSLTAKPSAYQVQFKRDIGDGCSTNAIPLPINSTTAERYTNPVSAHHSSNDHAHVTVDDGNSLSAVGSYRESDDSCYDEASRAYSDADSDQSNTEEQSTSSRPLSPTRRPHPSLPPAPIRSPSILTTSGQSIGSGIVQPTDRSCYYAANGGRSSVPREVNHIRRSDGTSITIRDTRFKFQPDEVLPMPRQFQDLPKRYRAGKGSNIPLNLNAFA